VDDYIDRDEFSSDVEDHFDDFNISDEDF